MTKQKAIAKYCLECSGDQPKEVIICHLADCPLWEYRCGYHIDTTRYRARIGRALKNYAKDVKALEEVGIHVDFRA